MIVKESYLTYAEAIKNRQGNMPDGGKKRDAVCGGNDFFRQMVEASEREASGRSGEVSAQEEFSARQSSTGQLIREASQDGKQLNREELMQLLAEHREEILKKIKNGDTGVKIPIGSMWLTEEEWEKLLDSFDEAQDEIEENIREKNGEELPKKRPDTTVNGDKVLAPEDTGHDLKPLEELAAEVECKGQKEDEDEMQNIESEERMERMAETGQIKDSQAK